MEPDKILFRLYIEDEGEEQTQDEYRRALRRIRQIKSYDGFHTVIYDAQWKGEEVWEQIKKHDEIYCSTSLVPLFGNQGSPTLFNGMMYKAIEENVQGKSIYILNTYESIWWHELRKGLVEKCFQHNKLFVLNDDNSAFIEVDIVKLIEEKL